MSSVKEQIAAYITDNLGLDDAEMIDELIQEYLKTFREYLAKVQQLLQAWDSDQLYRAAHSLKGCAGNVGHTRVHQIALELEGAAKCNDTEKARELYTALLSEAAQL